MKLTKIYNYNRIIKRWKNSGSASQLRCRNILLDLNIPKSLYNSKIYLGGLISIGDGSLGNQCEIHIETKVPWVYVCGDILYGLLVEKSVVKAGIIVYDEYVDIVCTIEDIEYIFRLCTYTESLRSWWIYNYLFNEVLLAPERTKKLEFLIKSGCNIKDAFEGALKEFDEEKMWGTLGRFTMPLKSSKAKNMFYLVKGMFGWKKSERGIVMV